MNSPKTNPTARAMRVSDAAIGPLPADKYSLRLYLAGATVRSRQALRRIYQLCEAELTDNYKLEVVDVYQQPELARADQIVATPTLLKLHPLPVRRIVGNMTNSIGVFGDEGVSRRVFRDNAKRIEAKR